MLAGDGASVRERVLGSEHVTATSEVAAGQPPAIQEAQDAVTALVWGGLWSRPGLGLRERSLITLAVVTALNQPGPVELHLRGALRNGLTPEEIAETLLHVGAYAGFSATSSALAVARRMFADPESQHARHATGRQ